MSGAPARRAARSPRRPARPRRRPRAAVVRRSPSPVARGRYDVASKRRRRRECRVPGRVEAAVRQLHRLPVPPRPVPVPSHRRERGCRGQGVDAGAGAGHRVRPRRLHERPLHDRQDEGRKALGARSDRADGRVPRGDRGDRRGRRVRGAGDDAVRAQDLRGSVRAQVPGRGGLDRAGAVFVSAPAPAPVLRHLPNRNHRGRGHAVGNRDRHEAPEASVAVLGQLHLLRGGVLPQRLEKRVGHRRRGVRRRRNPPR